MAARRWDDAASDGPGIAVRDRHVKALRYHGRRDLRLDDIPEPAVTAGTVDVSVDWCGICGSDMHEYLHGPIMVPSGEPHPTTGEQLPLVMGHEFAGTISAIGPGVADLEVGETVAVEPLLYCHACSACLRGDYHLCPRLAVIGMNGGGGGFAGHIVVPRYTVHRLPESMSTEIGALVEPLAVGWHAVRKANFRAGQTALVVGAGPIGLSTLLCLQAAGAHFTAVSVRRDDVRKHVASQLDADAVLDSSRTDVGEEIMRLTAGRGVDVVLETAGTQEAMDTAMASVCPGGTIVSLAVWPTPGRCDYMQLLLKEVTLVGSMCYSHAFEPVLEALARNRIRQPERMITKRVALTDAAAQGFESLAHDRGNDVKVLVKL
jgi:(R,R)-butanediol dehydrogenase / meso-butanediol dehydrogenase / diacetyl reductase